MTYFALYLSDANKHTVGKFKKWDLEFEFWHVFFHG